MNINDQIESVEREISDLMLLVDIRSQKLERLLDDRKTKIKGKIGVKK